MTDLRTLGRVSATALHRTRPTGHDGGHLTTPTGSRPWERMDLPIHTKAGTRPWSTVDLARWRPAARAALVVTAILLACGFVVAVMAAGPMAANTSARTGFGFDTRSYWGFPRVQLYPGSGHG